ncbi:MAG: hypothetical protein EYC70_10460 [Planctomycetota bacterium]|nr:MAG: hypothetical protein EYC70_10460 [Planctomycetota bacterium]
MSPHRSAVHRGHEHSDVPVRPVALAALVLAMGIAAALGLMWLLLSILGGAQAPAAAPEHPLARALPQFPQPRLQTDAAGDLARHRAWEDSVLQGYGWVDRERGIVRIPLERALAEVGQRGIAAAEQQLRSGGE